jgi:DNA-binding CsgD family transcriptional regulator/tetratricopeptide (TPR) repeat protein
MQPDETFAAKRVDVSPATAVAAARDLWFRADFDACLAVLDTIEPSSGSIRGEVLVLRARALYRLRRFRDVVEFLGPLLSTFTDVEEACTARMLHGAALARSGAVDRGLALLNEVAVAAAALHVHRAIRAEIDHARALAHWIKREPDEVLRLALSAEKARADVISVRAMQLRGFVELTNRRFPQALAIFRTTLNAYRACIERDDDLEEMTIFEIASLELTLRSARIGGTHNVPWGRSSRRGETDRSTPSAIRMQTIVWDAWLYAHDGDRFNAFRNARLAESAAPNDHWRVWALASRGAIANAFGDVDSAREHAAEAAELAARLDWDVTEGEERIGLLLLAEVLTATDPIAASSVLARYDGLASPMSADQVLSDDPRCRALEHHVRGLVLRSRGCGVDARKHLAAAYRLFRDCKHLWRATLTLIEMDATTVAAGHRRDFYLETASLTIREHFPHSFLARRLGRWLKAYDDPIVAKLTPAPREVLRFLLDGWLPKEIATVKQLAEGTIRNHIGDLESAFGVHSIQELIVACYRRGLGTARWSDDFDPTLLQRPGMDSVAIPPVGAVPRGSTRKHYVARQTDHVKRTAR